MKPPNVAVGACRAAIQQRHLSLAEIPHAIEG